MWVTLTRPIFASIEFVETEEMMMTYPSTYAVTTALPSAYVCALSMAMSAGDAPVPASADTIELSSPYDFAPTLTRLADALEGAGLTIFARSDHQAAAKNVGLDMPPTTVLIFGNPKGGTPLMLAAPSLALDLPMRVLVREDGSGHTLVAFHPALALTRAAGLPDDKAAGLEKSAALISAALRP